MPTYKVLLTDYAWPDLEIEHRLLSQADVELILPQDASEPALASAARDVDAIMTCWAKVFAPVMNAASRVRHIARLGIGLDNIDLATATQRGILVTNVPDYCLTEVAEHTLALLYSLARKTAFYHHATKRGHYQLQDGPPLKRMLGKNLGIIGLGNIGRKVAQGALALGLNVLAYSRSPVTMSGVRHVGLEDLLAMSDYVSLHLPLNPVTRHFIGRKELAAMKGGAYLINTARGGLIDHVALAEALADNRLSGAALDVQEPEPPDLNTPPYNDPRVIVTPHAAFASQESLIELRTRCCKQVIDCLAGRIPENVINPSLLRS